MAHQEGNREILRRVLKNIFQKLNYRLMLPRLSYFICAAPRSGSWLLAGGLENTHIAGHPNEWFNEPEERLRCELWGTTYPIHDYAYYLDEIRKEGMAGTDIFGVKCLSMHFERLAARIKTIPAYKTLPLKEIMPMIFPNTRYIRLKRRDTIGQAVSYFRASQTQVWWELDGQPAPGNGHPPIYDANGIHDHEIMLEKLEAIWDRFFKESGFPYLLLHYEELTQNYERTIFQALAYLGIQDISHIEITPPRFGKQADAISEEWVQRYREHKSAKGLN